MSEIKNTKSVKQEKTNLKNPTPSVGVQPNVRPELIQIDETKFHLVQEPRDCVRLLNIMVERKQTSDDDFSKAVVYALREYADSVEKNVTRCCEHFHTSNGCEVKVIAGSLYY